MTARYVALGLVLLTTLACDHKPPQRDRAGSASPAVSPASPAISPSAAVPGAPGSGSANMDISDECMEVGVKFAQILIDTASDVAEKSVLEQERTKYVRKQAESCMQNNWGENVRRCFMSATTRLSLQQCISAAADLKQRPQQPL